MTETLPEVDELLAIVGADGLACEFPRIEVRRERGLLRTRIVWMMSPLSGIACEQPAAQRVRVCCSCTTQTGWACLDHVALLRNPAARTTCANDHPAEVIFL